VIGAPAAATTSAGQPASEGGLFAALLALLAPGSNLSDTLLPDGLPAPLDGLAPTNNQLPDDLEAQLKAAAGKLGIDLASLGDLLADLDLPSDTSADPETFAGAVTSLVEALAAMAEAPADTGGTEGTAPDQLEAAVDALLALIGTPQPTPPPAPTPGETFSQLVGDLTEALTGSGKPSGDASPPTAPADTETADAPASTTQSGAAPADKRTIDTARTPLVEKLVHLLDDTAKAMAAANPQLAEKLATLAKSLPALPDNLLAALDAATTDDANKSAPQLASLIDQALRPRAAQRPAATPAFAAPRLDLPVPDDKTAGAPPVQPTATPKPPVATLASADSDPTPAASAAARPDTPAPAPNGNHPAPAAPQAESGPDKPAETAQTPATTAVAQQAAAAPAAAPRTVQAAYQQPTLINLPQVAFEIVRQVQAGNSRFQIRLDPAELGRIDVQLDVDRSGNVSARMVVDRPETLDLMQRDQRALQQALQQAGLDSSRTNLEFSLRQNPFAGDGSGNGRQQGQPGRQGGNPLLSDGGTDPIPEIYRGTAASGALNLFV
jgi:flagellar hook-length control protein FliK